MKFYWNFVFRKNNIISVYVLMENTKSAVWGVIDYIDNNPCGYDFHNNTPWPFTVKHTMFDEDAYIFFKELASGMRNCHKGKEIKEMIFGGIL